VAGAHDGAHELARADDQPQLTRRQLQAAFRHCAVEGKLLGNGAVTAPKLRNGAVTEAKLRNGAVTGAKIRAATIGPDSLQPQLRPLWARVSEGGTLVSGRGAVAAERTATGRYRVIFERQIAECSWTATVGRAFAGNGTSFGRVHGLGLHDSNTIVVSTRLIDNADFDRPFHLQVIC
jgi:hypothetical protein